MSNASINRWLNSLAALFRNGPTNKRKSAYSAHLQLEQLEERWLPSIATTDVVLYHAAGQPLAGVGSGSSTYGGTLPAAMRTGYGITTTSGAYQVMFGAVDGDGAGQTIAIVDAFNQPDIASDLANFDSTFGLPAPPSLKVINENGGSSLPRNASRSNGSNWGWEISLDVEWTHVMAPGASILLVEANSSDNSDLFAAVNTARDYPGVSVVSMSWGDSEFSGDDSNDSDFTTPSGHIGVTFLAASGDNGAGVNYPAVSPNVVGVGGTILTTGTGGAWSSETAWSDSGGGISAHTSQPGYQNGVVTQSTTQRTVPDVSMDADPSGGVPVYDSYDNGASTPWVQLIGTSLATPMWAGIIAIADQGRVIDGEGTLDGPSATLPMLYALATPLSSPAGGYASGAFHDITSGSNGAYSAGPGYDLVTGIGSPIVNVLVPDLVGATTTTLTDNGPNPSVYGTEVSFTVNETTSAAAFTSGETVSVEDASNGDAVVGTGTLTNGSATITVSDLSAGSHSLFAAYGGDLLHAASSSNQVSQTVSPIATATTLTDNGPNASIGGQTATFTITVSPAVPDKETVSLIDTSNGDAIVGTGTFSGGTAVISISSLPVGQHVIEAVYPGDADYSASTSSTVTQLVDGAPFVTTQPINQSVVNGYSGTFSAASGGYPTPTVQWQVSIDGGMSFNPIGGATSTTLNLGNVNPSENGYEYEAVFTNSAGSVTTNPATLAVDYLTTQPSSQIIDAGQTTSFTAATSDPSGTDTVQWQVNTGSGFTNLSDGGVYSGTATTTLTISGATAAMSGYQFDAVFTNSGGSLTTTAATLTVNLIQVTSVVVNQDFIPVNGASITNGVATLATDGNSGFTAGNQIVVAGFTGTQTGFDGTYTIATVSGNQITYDDSNTVNVSTTTFNMYGYAISANTTSDLLYAATSGTADSPTGAQRSMVDSIVYTFNTPVNLAAGAVTLGIGTGTTTGEAPATTTPDVILTPLNGGTIWVATFASNSNATVTGHSIADGIYTATLNSSLVTAISGGATMTTTRPTDTFYRLFGDVAANGRVNSTDSGTLNLSFGLNYLSSSGYLDYFDYLGNGRVNSTDSAALNLNFGSFWHGFSATI
jgi:Bacterial Ig-like domain (group 3)